MSTENTNHEGRSVNLGRHESQCSICQHPQRELIEERFLSWESPEKIAREHSLSRYALYRHAHACGLFSKRIQNVSRPLERIIEQSNVRIEKWPPPSHSETISAIKLLTKLNHEQEQTKSRQDLDVKALLGRMTKEERAAFAQDGALPDWLLGTQATTPVHSPGFEKEVQLTENTRVQ
jgi:hypothetical protein